jgi:CDGSH-type Zn-finger protein
MMSDRPYRASVSGGETIFWCACGRSARQPYCDGSHRGTVHRPLRYTAPQSLTVALCGCKASRQPPFCDGSHMALRAARDDKDRAAEAAPDERTPARGAV